MAAGKQARQHSEQDTQHRASHREQAAERDIALSSLLGQQRIITGQGEEDSSTQLQLSLGNRAVRELLKPRTSRTGSAPLVVQPKLMIGQPNDRYEQEADRVARQVVQRINAPQGIPQEAMEEESTVQRMSLVQQAGGITGGLEASDEVAAGIVAARSGGQPLDERTRTTMEQAFGGVDFREVRVHTDDRAAVLNRALSSRAFTTNQDVFFRKGEYQPGNRRGQELIAHELSHVFQQKAIPEGRVQRDLLGKKKNPGNVWNYLISISDAHGLEDFKSDAEKALLAKRKAVLEHIGSAEALYARFAKAQIVDVMELDASEQANLDKLWGWKDSITREGVEGVEIPTSLDKTYEIWKGKYMKTGPLKTPSGIQDDFLNWSGSAALFDDDSDLKALKQDYEKKRESAIKNEYPTFAWQGKMYDASKSFASREVRIYDSGTAVSADPGKRGIHALATPYREVTGAFDTGLKGAGEIIKHGWHLDAARKAGKLENAKKVSSFALRSAALISSVFIPQIGAIFKSVADLQDKGFNEWLDNAYQQYNAQISFGDMGKGPEPATKEDVEKLLNGG